MEAVDVNKMMFDAATLGIKNIFGDLSVAAVGVITIILVVVGLKWLLTIMMYRHTEEDVEDLHYKMKHSSGHSREVFRMKYRKAMGRLSKFED